MNFLTKSNCLLFLMALFSLYHFSQCASNKPDKPDDELKNLLKSAQNAFENLEKSYFDKHLEILENIYVFLLEAAKIIKIEKDDEKISSDFQCFMDIMENALIFAFDYSKDLLNMNDEELIKKKGGKDNIFFHRSKAKENLNQFSKFIEKLFDHFPNQTKFSDELHNNIAIFINHHSKIGAPAAKYKRKRKYRCTIL